MRILLVASAFPLMLCGIAQAQAAAVSHVDVVLADFSYSPKTIRLNEGQKVTLRLINQGSGGHNFSAPEFFGKAQIDPASAPLIRKGKVEVKKGATVDLTLTPAAGQYKLKCTHFLHSGFGMKGRIVVE